MGDMGEMLINLGLALVQQSGFVIRKKQVIVQYIQFSTFISASKNKNSFLNRVEEDRLFYIFREEVSLLIMLMRAVETKIKYRTINYQGDWGQRETATDCVDILIEKKPIILEGNSNGLLARANRLTSKVMNLHKQYEKKY